MKAILGYIEKNGRQIIYIKGLGERLYWERSDSMRNMGTHWVQSDKLPLPGNHRKAHMVLEALHQAGKISYSDMESIHFSSLLPLAEVEYKVDVETEMSPPEEFAC